LCNIKQSKDLSSKPYGFSKKIWDKEEYETKCSQLMDLAEKYHKVDLKSINVAELVNKVSMNNCSFNKDGIEVYAPQCKSSLCIREVKCTAKLRDQELTRVKFNAACDPSYCKSGEADRCVAEQGYDLKKIIEENKELKKKVNTGATGHEY
jgi:hypothetical protein